MRRFTLLFLITFGLLALRLAITSPVLADDTTPPTTYLNLSGTLGGSGWYVSTVDVKLRASDLQSSPASTTYQVDAGAPVNNTFTSDSNAILNSSFEDGVYPIVNNWDKVTTDSTRLGQSNLPAKFGYRSARVQPISTSFDYWTNRNAYVPVIAGNSYSASTWVMTSGLTAAAGQGAWFEAWAMDSSGNLSDQQLAVSQAVSGDNDWTLLQQSFTIPSGYDAVYLRLGAQGSAGQAWFDGVTMYTGTEAISQFTIVDNGTHSLTYSSTDNAGNVEPTNTYSPIKIDTADPQDWNGFGFTNTGNAHTWTMWITVRDITSGINPSTAMYRVYDVGNCDCWSNWTSVASVTQASDGSNAAMGYTGYVKLTTPATDYGNNALSNTPKVEFEIQDVAHSTPVESPVYALFGPWLQTTGSADVYSYGDILISGAPQAGTFNGDGIVSTFGNLSNFSTPTGWYAVPYNPPQNGATTLDQYLPQYTRLKSRAVALPGNKMPGSSGVYQFTGDYVLDNNSLTSTFQGATLNAVILINGNLNINQNYSLASGSAVAFIVSGNVTFASSVQNSEGFILAQGQINTGTGSSRLVHKGALAAIGGFTLARDLGKKGNPNNGQYPAEQIQFPAQYLANQGFAQLLSGTDSAFTWEESQ